MPMMAHRMGTGSARASEAGLPFRWTIADVLDALIPGA
jgi:hypothetical protein